MHFGGVYSAGERLPKVYTPSSVDLLAYSGELKSTWLAGSRETV